MFWTKALHLRVDCYLMFQIMWGWLKNLLDQVHDGGLERGKEFADQCCLFNSFSALFGWGGGEGVEGFWTSFLKIKINISLHLIFCPRWRRTASSLMSCCPMCSRGTRRCSAGGRQLPSGSASYFLLPYSLVSSTGSAGSLSSKFFDDETNNYTFNASFRTLIQNMRPAGKQKKLNPQEKKVNKILSNQNAREILKSRAITAINSQVEQN